MNEKQDIRAAVRSSRAARALDPHLVRRARKGFTREFTRAVEVLIAARMSAEHIHQNGLEGDRRKSEPLRSDQPRIEMPSHIRIACFVSTRGEPATDQFLEWAVSQGIEVLLPRSLPDGTLEWARLDTEPLVPGTFGIPEPRGAAVPQALRDVDIVFVPAAAISHDGTRLGWGRGFYDRELAALRLLDNPPIVFGVVFENEIFDRLPAEPHDVPVDGVISEVRTLQFG